MTAKNARTDLDTFRVNGRMKYGSGAAALNGAGHIGL